MIILEKKSHLCVFYIKKLCQRPADRGKVGISCRGTQFKEGTKPLILEIDKLMVSFIVLTQAESVLWDRLVVLFLPLFCTGRLSECRVRDAEEQRSSMCSHNSQRHGLIVGIYCWDAVAASSDYSIVDLLSDSRLTTQKVNTDGCACAVLCD